MLWLAVGRRRAGTAAAALTVAMVIPGCNRHAASSDEDTDEGEGEVGEAEGSGEPDLAPDLPPDLPAENCGDFFYLGQDEHCPDGSKCLPYSTTGMQEWDSYGCFPLDPEPLPEGEPCGDENPYDGEDPCGKGMLCYWHPWNGGFVCSGFCVLDDQDDQEWGCVEPDVACVLYGDLFAAVCQPVCDPLMQQDCPDGLACHIGSSSPVLFDCMEDLSAGGGGYAEDCGEQNECQPGFACIASQDVPGCASGKCCTPFCSLSSGDACPGDAMGQTCEPYPYKHPQAEFPEKVSDVGLCIVAG
jgi:hypothetical protein